MLRALIAGPDGEKPDEMALIALCLAGGALTALLTTIGLTIYAVGFQHAAWQPESFGIACGGLIAAPATAIATLAACMGVKARQEKS